VIGARGHVRLFCAICTNDIRSPIPKRAPLGKNGALVNVCDDCHDEPAREKRGPVRGYESNEGMSNVEMQAKISGFARANNIHAIPRNETMRTPTPDWIVIRVPRRNALGVSRDANEARATLRGKYRGVIRFLGFDAHWVLFERPPQTKYVHARVVENPLAALERFRVVP